MGNSKNSLIKEALECYRDGKESYLLSLLEPGLSVGLIRKERINKEEIKTLADEIVSYNLSVSLDIIVEKSPYIREQVENGKIWTMFCFLPSENR